MGEREQDREQDDLPNGNPRKPKLTWDWLEIEETEDLKMEPPDGGILHRLSGWSAIRNWNRRMEAALNEKLMADGSLNVSIAPLKPLKRFRIPQKKVMSDERLGGSGSEVDTNAAHDLFPPNPSSATDFIF
jgi:hypothetical protein